MSNKGTTRLESIADLVEFITGEGCTISLVALPEGLQIGATVAIRGETGGVEATLIPWRRLSQMRKLATALRGK